MSRKLEYFVEHLNDGMGWADLQHSGPFKSVEEARQKMKKQKKARIVAREEIILTWVEETTKPKKKRT